MVLSHANKSPVKHARILVIQQQQQQQLALGIRWKETNADLFPFFIQASTNFWQRSRLGHKSADMYKRTHDMTKFFHTTNARKQNNKRNKLRRLTGVRWPADANQLEKCGKVVSSRNKSNTVLQLRAQKNIIGTIEHCTSWKSAKTTLTRCRAGFGCLSSVRNLQTKTKAEKL